MRFTSTDGTYKEYIFGSDLQTVIGVKEWNNSLTQKLSKLENTEEEIGVDLNIWANAVYHGIYVKGKEPEWGGVGTKKDIAHYSVVRFNEHTLIVRWASDCDSHIIDEPMKKYGKLWALTKEELQ